MMEDTIYAWAYMQIGAMLVPYMLGIIQGIIGGFSNVVKCAWINERVYSSSRSKNIAPMILKNAMDNMWFTLGGKTFMDGQEVQDVIVGNGFVVYSSCVYEHQYARRESFMFTVWTVKGMPLIVPDTMLVINNKSKDVIHVWNRDFGSKEFYTTKKYELTLSPGQVADGSMYHSDKCAEEIKSIYNRGIGNVFVLYGEPGTGKSTTLRLLAKIMDAKLYARFDPRRPFESVDGVCNEINHDEIIIIGIEEFDIILDCLGKPKDCNGPVMVHDKKSWNEMLDDVSRLSNVILVMTTNKPIHILKDPNVYDPSLLRDKRVTAFLKLDS